MSADDIVTVAVAWIVSIIESVDVQPVILSVMFIVYVVVPVTAVTVGLAADESLRFVLGDQVYV